MRCAAVGVTAVVVTAVVVTAALRHRRRRRSAAGVRTVGQGRAPGARSR
ncbi:hypothetical protein DMP14_26520 [Pseudonocardia sp. Ae707_Ps2]